MIPVPTASATSIDGRRRNLSVAIGLVTLLTFVAVIADLAIGGRPDPAALRAASVLLDGPWRFRTGDDPRWADPALSDGDWDTIDLTAAPGSHDGDVGLPDYVGGWKAHGYPDHHGYAWYRRAVFVPAGGARWDVLGPTLVDHGYEIYWNGQRLGGSGRLGPQPRVVGTRPMQFALPAGAAGTRGILAVRAYMLPGSGGGAEGGGMHTAPILAPRPTSDALHRVQWQRTIAGYVVDFVEPVALFALVLLVLKVRSASDRKAFWMFAGVALVLTGARRLNNAIVAWTDLQALTTYSWLASVMWIPTVTAWVLAWNRWPGPARRGIDVAAAALMLTAIIGVSTHSSIVMSGSRLAMLGLFVVIGARIARSGPMRGLALVALAGILLVMFGGELLDPIGVPGIWFPFGIGVSRTQYLLAALIPLLAFFFVRTLRSERMR